jgi:hypothetical protein
LRIEKLQLLAIPALRIKCRQQRGGPDPPLDALYKDMHPKARAKPRSGEKLTLKAQVRRTSEVDATERHERQIAALARLIREAAIRRWDRRRRT